MLIRNYSLYNSIVRAPEGEGGPDLEAQIRAAVEAATAPLKAKADELLNEKKQEQARRTELEIKLKSFADVPDLDKAKELYERMMADADLNTVATGGKDALEAVVQRRTKKIIDEERKKVDDAQNTVKQAQLEREEAFNRWRSERLATAANSAMMKFKVLPENTELIQYKVERMFFINDDDGKPHLKEGVESIDRHGNPHSLETFVESLKDSNPTLFGYSSGGGSSGGGNGGKGTPRDPVRIDANDRRTVSNSLEDIAAGKVIPVQNMG